jgi:hypothetical protein
MKEDRLPWFPCYPSKLLGALAAMNPDEGYVYWIVCLRIYETGRPCCDSVEALARRSGMNKRRVSEALDLSFRAGRLVRDGDGIMNPFTAEVMSEAEAFRKGKSRAGKEGARVRWEKDPKNQRKGDGTANAPAQAKNGHLHLQEDSIGLSRPIAPGVDLFNESPEPKSDPMAELYRRGREIFGDAGGGLVRKLLDAKGGSIPRSRAAIEEASVKDSPREYVGAIIRKGAPRRGGGFAAVTRELMEKHANEEEGS